MAVKKSAPKSKSQEIIPWEEQLAKEAQIAAEVEASSGGGQFFSVRGGTLTWQDAPIPGNQMAVVIVDAIFETTYYEGKFDPDTPQNPVAFAFGRDEKTLTWHENSHPDFAGKLCVDSEVCEWGSADTGRGKAARETRRLAIIPAGTFSQSGKFEMFDDVEHFESTAIGFMKLPVTSVKGYASFVKQVAGALRRPPFGIVTKIRVVPDSKTQFKVTFEPITNVPDELMDAIMKRRSETEATIDFPYTPFEEAPPPPPRRTAVKSAQKSTAVKRGKY